MSVSRMATGRPAGVRHVDGAEVDGTDLGRVVVEQADEAELRHEVRDELLGPFAAEAAQQPAVARVEVAADADRVAADGAGDRRPPPSAASGRSAPRRAGRGTG